MTSLNRFYLDEIAPNESRAMVDGHQAIHGGRVNTLCNVTAAALAWLITGVDLAAPFSGAWYAEKAEEGTGPDGVDRLVAYSTVNEGSEIFDDNYMLLMLHRNGKTLLIDSDLLKGRGLTVREVAGPPPPQGGSARHICLPPHA
jgi:hypothetical protein